MAGARGCGLEFDRRLLAPGTGLQRANLVKRRASVWIRGTTGLWNMTTGTSMRENWPSAASKYTPLTAAHYGLTTTQQRTAAFRMDRALTETNSCSTRRSCWTIYRRPRTCSPDLMKSWLTSVRSRPPEMHLLRSEADTKTHRAGNETS